MSFNPEDKSSTADGKLLQEIGDYLLQENGDKIVLDDVQEWTPETKNT